MEAIVSLILIGTVFICTVKIKALLYKKANRKDDTNVKNHIGN